MSNLDFLEALPKQEIVKQKLSEKQKLEKLENLITDFRKENWKSEQMENYLSVDYINSKVFSAYIVNKLATIWSVYQDKPESKEVSKSEVIKNVSAGLYFLIEKMLNKDITELDTNFTNLKMVRILENLCNRGIMRVFVKSKNTKNGQIEEKCKNSEEIDFTKLDENLQSRKSFEQMIATFSCHVDQELLEHLKLKITTLHWKELKELNQESD